MQPKLGKGVAMDDADVRLALLQTELETLQGNIRSIDAISFQVKGWCVTAALAIGSVAVTYHRPALLVVGMGAVIGFFLVNCQFKVYQRIYINRNTAIDAELRRVGVVNFVKDGAGGFDIVGTGIAPGSLMQAEHRSRGFAYRMIVAIWNEASHANTYGLYLFIVVCMMIGALILT